MAGKIGCSGETLRNWVRQAERDRGVRAGPRSAEGERMKALEREGRELRRADEILRKASACFAMAELDRRYKPSRSDPPGGMGREADQRIAFIDAHGKVHGLEPRSGSRPICQVLPIAPSTCHEHAARCRDPDRAPVRQKRDAAPCQEIRRVFEENFGVYGVRKVWRQMLRDGASIARCTVGRLMRQMGLKGVVRGKAVKTTVSDKGTPCPLDRA